MKKQLLHIFCITAALLISSAVFGQDYTTYTDDFETSHDYLADGVEGTMWDGILLNDSIWNSGGTVAEITALNTSDYSGQLIFSSMNSAWAVGADYGAALYKTIENGADFEIQVKITGGDFPSFDSAQVFYHMPGLIAKVEDDTTFVLLQSFDIYGWGAVHGVRDIIPAEGLAQENWINMNGEDTLSIAKYPYIKLEKYEDDITGYCSTDGMAWVTIYTVSKPEFAGKNIQVGLYSATYTADEGQVLFDDLELTDYTEVSAVELDDVETGLRAYYDGRQIHVRSTDNQVVTEAKLYSITGALVYSKSDIRSAEFNIPVASKGIYVLTAESNGTILTEKVIVQ